MAENTIVLASKINPVTVDLVMKSKLLNDLKIKLAQHNISLTPASIMKGVGYAMEVVELSELKGEAQKTMAVSLVATLINEINLEPEDKTPCFPC